MLNLGMKTMTFEDYAVDQDWLSTLLYEEKMNEGGYDPEFLYEAILEEAKKDKVAISDAETCNYEEIIDNIFHDCDFDSIL